MTPRRALVTAGAAGIGRAIAERLKLDGFDVVVTDIDESAVADARDSGFTAKVANAGDFDSVKALADELSEETSTLDLLVNNAGIAGPTARVAEIDVAEWQQTVDINLSSQFFHVKAMLPLLRNSSSASIVNLSSAAGRLGMFGRAAYTATKAGVIGFTKTLAIELGPEKITANAICPGAVGGVRIDRVIAAKAEVLDRHVDEVAADYREQSAIQEFIDADSIAGMVSFLAGPDARQINGQTLNVDGYTQKLY